METYFFDQLSCLRQENVTVYTEGTNACFQGFLAEVNCNYCTLIQQPPGRICDIPINKITAVVHCIS